MIKRNKLTVLTLLLLSPLETHATDDTQKPHGKESDVGDLSLNKGEIESSHLSHITHESSMPKSINVLKNYFFEQAKMASDQSLSMTSISGKPNGEWCVSGSECESGWCDGTCQETIANGEPCIYDFVCKSGRCSSSFKCEDKRPNGETCGEDEDCESDHCKWDIWWNSIGSCADPPTPSPGPCFSSESLVTHSEHGLIPISEIEVGDYVLDSKFDGSFSRVYALEQNHYVESAFYQLHLSTGTLLELTDRHMVYLRNKALPLPARDMQVGDVLMSHDPQDDMEVVEVKIIHRNGYYNPVTESGKIVLNNGVVASSFSVAKSSSSNFFDNATELIHWHTLSQLANAPLRFVCRVWFGFCANERFQNEEGLHKFIVLLKNSSNLPKYQQFAVLPAIFGAGIMFTVLEFFYDQGEAFYKTTVTFVEAGSEGDASGVGSFSFLITCFLTVATLVPSVILIWRKKYHYLS